MKPVTLAAIAVATAFVLLILVSVIVAGRPWYVVNEAEQVVITQFGKPVGQPLTTPGLKFKIPYLQKANVIDKRLLDWDGAPNEVPTKDMRFVVIDTCARWRIVDPLLFFQSLGHERGAQSRLDHILDGETRAIVAEHDLIEVVRSTDREFVLGPPTNDSGEQITSGRRVLEQEILDRASARTLDFGIEIADFQFKRTEFVKSDIPRVYKRMISERKRIAEEIRRDGAAEAARIRGGK